MRGAALLRRVVVTLLVALFASAGPVLAAPPEPAKQAVAIGTGGSAASVDALGTQAAIRVLDHGGNAVDAAVAAAAVLGVVEPYSCGIGGGGFMLIYSRASGRVYTLDGRETAPLAFNPESFIDPVTGTPISFAEGVTSGLGVGVPGTLLLWDTALRRFGTYSLARALAPAIPVAARGFVVDQTFADQTASNLNRFKDFTSTRAVFLTSDGGVPPVGSRFQNPLLAETYSLIADDGVDAFYRGPIASAIVNAVQHPPLFAGATRNVRPGLMVLGDLGRYVVVDRPPTHIGYRGLDVYGMGPPSSGGSTVAEALNILEGFDLGSLPRADALHLYFEASALAYADRNAYLGDPDFVSVPLAGLLSDAYATQRRALIGPTAAPKPVAAGNPWPYNALTALTNDPESPSTTHLTVSDRFGNIVTYTFTIEQIGGSGIAVPGYGFLLNNELTDFEFVPGRANSPAGGKRPRSSMAPTIVLDDGHPLLATGSPGGASIITTVLQVLLNRLDFGMSLPDALAAPRASQRNSATTQVEPSFLATPEATALAALGHRFSTTPEIGAVTGIEFLGGGNVLAAAEPVRRGGGSAMVEEPATVAAAVH